MEVVLGNLVLAQTEVTLLASRYRKQRDRLAGIVAARAHGYTGPDCASHVALCPACQKSSELLRDAAPC
jgi:hypothetical protein